MPNPPPMLRQRILLPPRGLAPAVQELSVQADLFDGQIDLRAFAARYPHYPVLSSSPMVLEPEQGRFFFLSRFGAVVSWNCPASLVQTLHDELRALPGVGTLVESARDQLMVVLGSPEDRVGYNEVWFHDLTLEKLRIVSLALGQSVALDHFDAEVSEALGRFQPVVRLMGTQGRLSLKHGDVLKMVGFAMDVRSAVLNTLALFEDPPETWDNEALDHLHLALYHQFDLEKRLAAINQKLAYLSDAGSTVMEVLATRTSHRLEWIIIVLIFIETAFFVYKEILFR